MTQPEDPTQAVPAAAVVGGRYRLDRLVGRGGTAEVWQATDTALDRRVALKLVTAPHDESAVRAADEARTLAQLSHPNLVQVYDAGTDTSGRPWVVMEFVEGSTLADEIRTGPIAPDRLAGIGAGVADALAHVHARGMVHRDVKPANVLIGVDGAVKLTDFGIARLVDAAKVTSTGLMVGTASYLAPEQVAGEPVGPAADVYALGLVLLEALTGVREYEGPAVEAAMARLTRGPVVPASVPADWAEVLQAMTRREPSQRATSADAAAALRALVAGQDPTTLLPQPGYQPTTALPRTTAAPRPVAPAPTVTPVTRSSRAPWVVAGLLAAVVLGGAGYALSQQDQGGAEPKQVPPVSRELPQELHDDLQDLVDRVGAQ